MFKEFIQPSLGSLVLYLIYVVFYCNQMILENGYFYTTPFHYNKRYNEYWYTMELFCGLLLGYIFLELFSFMNCEPNPKM